MYLWTNKKIFNEIIINIIKLIYGYIVKNAPTIKYCLVTVSEYTEPKVWSILDRKSNFPVASQKWTTLCDPLINFSCKKANKQINRQEESQQTNKQAGTQAWQQAEKLYQFKLYFDLLFCRPW